MSGLQLEALGSVLICTVMLADRFLFTLQDGFVLTTAIISAVLLTIVLALEGLYCFVVFTDIPAIKSLREAYIETAMNTLSHQWLAKWFLPSYMIDEVVARQDQARKDQEGKISTWDKISASDATDKNGETVAPTEPDVPDGRGALL